MIPGRWRGRLVHVAEATVPSVRRHVRAQVAGSAAVAVAAAAAKIQASGQRPAPCNTIAKGQKQAW
eukprot:1136803-Pelagomonas_calceolata.AAC.5